MILLSSAASASAVAGFGLAQAVKVNSGTSKSSLFMIISLSESDALTDQVHGLLGYRTRSVTAIVQDLVDCTLIRP